MPEFWSELATPGAPVPPVAGLACLVSKLQFPQPNSGNDSPQPGGTQLSGVTLTCPRPHTQESPQPWEG